MGDGPSNVVVQIPGELKAELEKIKTRYLFNYSTIVRLALIAYIEGEKAKAAGK